MDTHFKRLIPDIEAALDRFMPLPDATPARLHQAMRYSLFAGGKRLRPILVALAYEASGGQGDGYLPVACAVEMVHTYSLIHDDLPAMDDDDLRRGKPTCHRVFGEAVAILAGDGLLTHAFEVLTTALSQPEMARLLVRELACAAGGAGMVGGQVLDLEGENAEPDEDRAWLISNRKTAALLRASSRMGALAAGASPYLVEKMGCYGEKVGLVFQVVDDILDLCASADELGKTPGKDLRSKKLTLASVLGVDGARRRAEQWADEACRMIQDLDGAEPLTRLARFILNRRS